MKKMVKKMVADVALSVAKKSADSACIWNTHQPKVPAKLLKK